MFRAVLEVQWRWTRTFLLLVVLLAFAVPVISARSDLGQGQGVLELVSQMEAYGYSYPLLAVIIGSGVALAILNPDLRGRYVYALSLPVLRWHLVLLRFGAGIVLLLLPAAALFLGALLASATATLPPGLHAYPLGIGFRFVLATLVAFGVTFMLAGSPRRVVLALLLPLGAVILTQVVLVMVDSHATLLGPALESLFGPIGPFRVLTGRWMLFDV